jgi:hypothetical protein
VATFNNTANKYILHRTQPHRQIANKGIDHLQVKNLFDTKITDAGLEHLKGLKQLRELHLIETQVTDAGVKKLNEALPKLFIQC